MLVRRIAQSASIIATATALCSCDAPPTNIISSDPIFSGISSIPVGRGYFATESTLPFHAPDFDQISEDDYLPAFEQGIEIQEAEVASIINNPSSPTFENTILALEKSGLMLGRVSAVFFALTGAHTNIELDQIEAEISPKLTSHLDSINLNPELFERVRAIYERRSELVLESESKVLLERTYSSMVQAGALLDEDQRERVREINGRLATLTTEFSQRVRKATVDGAVIVDTIESLAGLSASEIDSAAALATERGLEGKFAIALQNTTQQPLLPVLENRELRERLYKASAFRADQGGAIDTRMILSEIATLRAEKANIFGSSDWATYTMYDRMAKNPETAIKFMEEMIPALASTQRREAAILNTRIAAEGLQFEVQPWDWYRFAEKVKAEQYSYDESEVMAYFELKQVLEQGVFYMAEKLYGLTFDRRNDIPIYHPDVWVYTVFEADGSELGLFYFDPFQRPSKRGGAWMSNFVDQSFETGNKPVIYNVLNIPKAADGEPQLVSFDWVETTFHEFGHALHGFFADQQYETLSGTATARDFVEYPSQVHEMWATYPEVLQNYAKHHETGETIPFELIEKIQSASKFNQGYDFGEVVTAALLDMKWHSLTREQALTIDTPEKVDAFERNSLLGIGLEIDLVPPRYRSNYFNHIFSSPAGYSAGYYSYLWTEMLDKDSRKWFLENGGLTRQNGDHYRAQVLSRGGTMDYFEMFENFTGRQPNVEPMLASRGLLDE